MNPQRRTDQIDRLAQAIRLIAADFEKFGGQFLDAYLEVPLTHQGVNLLGYPVKGVVDSVSADGRIAAEYSAERGYFDGQMKKAGDDLDKALKRRPSARDIFLLSAEKRRPELAQAFEARVGKMTSMQGTCPRKTRPCSPRSSPSSPSRCSRRWGPTTNASRGPKSTSRRRG